MTSPTPGGWHLLIVSTPGRQAALRMRLWRHLKASGAAILRDGVYVLPRRPRSLEALEAQACAVAESGGSAKVLSVDADGADFAGLFDRTAEYGELVTGVRALMRTLRRAKPGDASRSLARFGQAFEDIAQRDFFPGEAREQARAALDELAGAVRALHAPGEPHAARRRIVKLDPADFRGRVWATRKRPWVDRLASAWLVHRYVDPTARIRWLDTPGDCPARAVGFDFDGARFTHTGGMVTFEVLAASFTVPVTPALEKLQAIVHFLDVGGLPVPEAPGVQLALAGLCRRHHQDDALLAAAEDLFDALLAGASDQPHR
jgi:hypothetical protein